jgi:hypothetical protein
MRTIRLAVFAAASLAIASPSLAVEASAPQAAAAEKCEHGVKKGVCARCNPKLEPVFKAKGDWCGEHARPESQCVKCSPKLAKEGVK